MMKNANNASDDFVCTQCDRRIPKNAAFQEKFSDEERESFRRFHESTNQQLKALGQSAFDEYVEPEDDPRFWHSRNITIGVGGGRIGCHIETITCGPLRELNETDEEIVRLENLLGVSLQEK